MLRFALTNCKENISFTVSERKREKKKVIQGRKLIMKSNFPDFQGHASHHHFSSLKLGKITFHERFSSLNDFFSPACTH